MKKNLLLLLLVCALLVGCGEEAPTPSTQNTQPTTEPPQQAQPPAPKEPLPETPEPAKTDKERPESGAEKTDAPPQQPAEPAATVIKTYPKQGDKIDAGTITIKIRFSEAMGDVAISPDEIEGFAFPEQQAAPFFRNNKELFVKVDLESEKEYALGINQGNERFKTADGRPVAPFALKFHTKKDNSNIYGWSEMCDKEIGRDEALLNLLAREGDKIKVTGDFKLTQTVVDSFGGQVGARNITEHTGKSTHTDEILAIRKNEFHKIKRSYGQAYMQTIVRGSMLEQKPFVAVEPVTDKTYLLERSGSSYEVTCEGSPVSGDEEKKAKYEMTLPDFLPRDKIVRKGESFKPEGKWMDGLAAAVCALSAVKADSGSSTITVTKVEYVENNKTTIARFSLAAKIKGTWIATGAPGEIDFEGALSINATNGRLIAVIIDGKGKFTGTADPISGGTKNMEIETHIETKWSYE